MIGLPKIDLDIKGTVAEFLELMRDMNRKLDVLIDIERGHCDKGSLWHG